MLELIKTLATAVAGTDAIKQVERKKRTLNVIAAISFGRSQIIMRGGLKNNAVIVTSRVEHLDNRESFIKVALDEYRAKKDQGYEFITNNSDPALQGKYRAILLSASAILGGRTLLFEALEVYFKLETENRLILSLPNLGLRPDHVERSTNDSGQNTYRVNWDYIRPEAIGTLLICHAMTVESPYNPRFLKELYQIQKKPPENALSESQRLFQAVTHGFDKKRRNL